MRCLTAILITLSMISAAQAERVRLCVLFCLVETTGPVDSFAALYERVIRTPAEADEVKRLSRALRERLTRNEVLYRCATGWSNPICKQ